MHELDVLYDEEFVNNLSNFAQGHSIGILLESKKIQKQIEAWYAELPIDIKNEIYKRLQDKNDNVFVGALAELYVHHWFLKDLQVSSIEYEPPIGRKGGKPDFRVSLPDGNKVICEVYSPQDIGEESSRDEITKEFSDQCAKWLPNGYILSGTSLQKPKDKEAVTELVRSLRLKLERRDFQAGSEFELSLEEEAFHVEVPVLSKKDTDSPTDVSWIDWFNLTPTANHVQKRLQEKARKFSEALEVPFLMIAIDETGKLMSENSWLDICYGKGRSVTELDKCTGETVNKRILPREGGLFTRVRDCEPRASYISAVIAGRRKTNAKGLYFDLQCYMNPFADYPIPEIFDDLIPVWKTDSAGRLIKIESPSSKE